MFWFAFCEGEISEARQAIKIFSCLKPGSGAERREIVRTFFRFPVKSKHPEAARAIRKWISERNLRPGASLPSGRFLAKEIGFSRVTAALACNNLISGGLLKRNGYKLLVGEGAPVRAPVSGDVCLLSYSGNFLKVAGRTLDERGVKHRAVELSYTKHPSPAPVLREVFSEKPAGMILWMGGWIEGLVPLLEKETSPLVVCANAVPPGLRHSSVGTDVCWNAEIALKHLFGLGHRKIACVSLECPISRSLEACFMKGCWQLGISSRAIWRTEARDKDEFREMLLERLTQNPGVTAIVAGNTLAKLAAAAFDLPREFSVVSLFDSEQSSLTAVTLRDQDACIASWACTEIISRIQSAESGRPMPPPHHALFVPELIDRGSTRALAHREKEIAGVSSISPMGRIGGMGRMAASPGASWTKTYTYLKRSRTHNWRQLDLSKLANHSMTREHGWLGGEPLLHFPSGLRSIHGVPFQVIEENRNGGRAVVTFRSPHTHSAEGKALPVLVKLPVGGPVKALYFLHGCGHARPTAFAEYRIHFTTGPVAIIPLALIGTDMKSARQRLGKLKPNLQDWWPSYPQQDFPHAKYVTVFNPADPQEYERYLYTLEWINPRPKDEISHIEVRVDPKAGPALGLVAVTALR